MHLRRYYILSKVFILSFIILTFRLFYIQVCTGEKLAKAATAQRVVSAEIKKPRGGILDRNGIPLTNRKVNAEIVLKPLFLRDRMGDVEQICQILGIEFNKIRREIEVKKEPILIDTEQEKKNMVLSLQIQGVSAVNSLERYDKDTLAKHVIGYLNRVDQIGETGIEKSFEDLLKLNSESSVAVITDARDNLLQGLGYRIISKDDEKNKNNVRLTLDYHIQKVVEEVMKENKIKGAVVIEDVSTGDILAMASKPDFDQNNVGKYLDSPGNELFNRAVASYNLGSIFKIIDVAAYFESSVSMDEHNYCTGLIQIGDKEYRCFNGTSHGDVDLTSAFAQSCNAYFIKMGIKLGNKSLLEMAKRFGIGTATGVKEQGIMESAGNIPVKKYYTDGEIANISIGQGDILATPLQVADMIATIANGGIKNRVSIVDALVDHQGEELQSLRIKEGKRIISREIAEKIKVLMEEVTISGTGRRANLEEFGGSGGKTGSAETGQYINGDKVVHAWFAGYFPRKYPRYSIAVFVENGKSGSEAAVPVFTEIAEKLAGLGY